MTAHFLVGDFLGCYGRIVFGPGEMHIHYACAPFGERMSSTASRPGVRGYVLQWLHPGADAVPPQPVDQEYLLLSGPVIGPVSNGLARRIAAALKDGRYAELARVPGQLAGCLVTPRKVFLFRSVTSQEGLHYRRDNALLRWSTDLTDLLEEGCEEFDREAIWRCCRGDESAFIYRNLTLVRPGQVVVFDENTTTTVRYDQITPLDLPRRTSLTEYAELAYELVLQDARSYARSGRVGILLSGGLDSATVLTALVEAGADVVAYHMACDDPLADESGYARAVCDHLSVPFVPVAMETGDGYLSREWSFPHPFGATGFRWLEQIAERIHRDQITFLTWGADGDMIFGPQHYALHDVLFGDLPLEEKAALCRGLVCSRFELPRVLRSVAPSSSLLDDCLPTGDNARGTDFLTPLPDVPEDSMDYDYEPKDHIMDLTLWRPRGILLACPLGARDVRRLAARMPNAYRVLPYQGRLITKPVLRLILSTRLPAKVWRKYGRLWMLSPHKNYSLTHPHVFADLLGSPDSELVKMGVVDPQRLAGVLAEPSALRRHSDTLIFAAMTELFLRNRAKTTTATGRSDRGGFVATG
jgi:asparagine synthase (glutamine-hydrolysing)